MPKLHVFHSETPLSVILFRKKYDYEMILWNRDDNTFQRGQWIKFVKIYTERCSFDGKYFLYFYMSLHNNASETYTVISKPPYFTMKAMWKEVGTWTDPRIELFTGNPETMKGKVPDDFDTRKHMTRLPPFEDSEDLLQEFKDDKFTLIKAPDDY